MSLLATVIAIIYTLYFVIYVCIIEPWLFSRECARPFADDTKVVTKEETAKLGLELSQKEQKRTADMIDSWFYMRDHDRDIKPAQRPLSGMAKLMQMMKDGTYKKK